MQWDKVKNVLLVILLAVNAFLIGNLALRHYQNVRAERELYNNVHTLLAARGITLADGFSLPADKVLPTLWVERSRTDEQAMVEAVLGADARTEQEEGAVRFESADGSWLRWSEDGTVQGNLISEAAAGESPDLARVARELFTAWGLWDKGAAVDVVDRFATLTAPVVQQPVHNRSLTLYFGEDGRIELTGFWSFGTPYAYARETGVSCAAADALLGFAATARHETITRIDEMTVGYRLLLDSSGRLQLMPTWKIQTDTGEYLVDCAKKTSI